jgi:hypothetical protein
MTRVGRICFDFGAKAPDVDIYQSTVTENAVTPDLFEQVLSGKYRAGVICEFNEQAELGLCEMNLLAASSNESFLRDYFKIIESEAGVSWRCWSGPAQHRSNPS